MISVKLPLTSSQNAKAQGRIVYALSIVRSAADLLPLVSMNRHHFDRWIAVIPPHAPAIKAQCERHDIDWRESEELGVEVEREDNEWKLLDEVLSSLVTPVSHDSWVALMDGCILLPHHFRARLNALPLEAECAYLLPAAKCCENMEMLLHLQGCEPWERTWFGGEPETRGIMFYHLKDWKLRRDRDRLKIAIPDTSDEVREVRTETRRVLPFYALRIDQALAGTQGWLEKPPLPPDFPELFRRTPGGPGAVLVVGYSPGGRWEEISRDAGVVHLIDVFQLKSAHADPVVEADRGALRKELESVELARPHLVHHEAAHGGQGWKIAPQSVDIVYLHGQLSSAWLCTAMPRLLQLVKPGGLICGDLYGFPCWGHLTRTLALLLGAPDVVKTSGFWWKAFHPTNPFLPGMIDGRDQPGRISVIRQEQDRIEALTITLHAIRKEWRGKLRVLAARSTVDEVALRIVTARFGAVLEMWADGSDIVGEIASDPLRYSTVDRELFLRPGDIMIGSMEGLLDESADASLRSPTFELPAIFSSTRGPRLVTVPSKRAQDFSEGSALVYFDDRQEEWPEEAWAIWCRLDVEAALASATEIALIKDTTVVSIVTAEELEDFEKNWISWSFPQATPIRLFMIGLQEAEVWLPHLPPQLQVEYLDADQTVDLPSFLLKIADACTTPRVTFISPSAVALPGAELWSREVHEAADFIFHSSKSTEAERLTTGNSFAPRTIFAQLTIERLRAVAWSAVAKRASFNEFNFVLHAFEAIAMRCNLHQFGWRFPRQHDYRTPEGQNIPSTSPLELIHQRPDGLRQLAEDVVVISLPERRDRQDRIRQMMNREGLWFRFSDGIRVRDEEIQPFEVAGVGRQNFKMAAGFEKYLRGMVGCRRAHLAVLERARAEKKRSLLLMEDDMHFAEGWFPLLEEALQQLPEGWLQLNFSALDFRSATAFSPRLRCLNGAYQATAILYSEAGIVAACHCLRYSRSEIDHWMGNHLHPFGNSFVVMPDIAYQNGGFSDIMSIDRGITA